MDGIRVTYHFRFDRECTGVKLEEIYWEFSKILLAVSCERVM